MESRRQQYRVYLEKTGVIDSISQALIHLYEEENKPEDALRYIIRQMQGENPIEEEYEVLKADHLETLKTVAELEEEISRLKGNIKLTEDEIQEKLDNGFKNLNDDSKCKSLLKKHLSEELLSNLRSLKTSNGGTILDCIQSGLENCSNSKIGIYAADSESYVIYRALFDPMILDYYDIQESVTNQIQKPPEWGNPASLRDLDPEGQYIKSIRISVSRNLKDYPFVRLLSEDEFKKIGEKVRSVLSSLADNYKGTHLIIKEIEPEIYSQMIHKKIGFDKKNKILDSAGCYRFWPIGREIFHTEAEDLIVWINAEDHVQIISTDKSGNLSEIYQKLVSFATELEKSLDFVWDDRYGYLTFSLENLGTTLKISTQIKLPNLKEDRGKMNELLESLNMKIIETKPRRKYESGDIFEISTVNKLGLTEFECVKNFEEGISKLLKAEENSS